MLKINTNQDQTRFLKSLASPRFWCRGDLNYISPGSPARGAAMSLPVPSFGEPPSLFPWSRLFNPQSLLASQHHFPACLGPAGVAGEDSSARPWLELPGCHCPSQQDGEMGYRWHLAPRPCSWVLSPSYSQTVASLSFLLGLPGLSLT